LAQRTQREENRDNDFAWWEFVDCETLEIDYEYGHGEWDAGAPKDVGDNECPKGMLGVRENFRDNTS
jgi:hypothetical protein